MKVLFLTTYNVTLKHEHFFTINVWRALVRQHSHNVTHSKDELILGTIVLDAKDNEYVDCIEADGHQYYQLHLSSQLKQSEIVGALARFFTKLKVDVIHSNMIEGYDVEAAKLCHIPICLTIHIGGFICPRGGGNGFLRYDDTICNQPVGFGCSHCCASDIPFPGIAYALSHCIPSQIACHLLERMRRPVFYLTPLLLTKVSVQQCQERIELFKYATIFAANERLRYLLALNGLRDNVMLLPHGVEERERLPYPPVDDKVKFFFLGRLQYSKGLHVLLRALEGIDRDSYELHVIGDAGKSRADVRYEQSLHSLAKDKSVIFHGRIRNDEIEGVIKSMHIMIHSAICLEVYGISIAESLAMGRPVLATRCGGAEMQVKEGVNGWLVNPNDVDALRKSILKVIRNKEQLIDYSARCSLPHPIDAYAAKLWDIYRDKNNNDSF